MRMLFLFIFKFFIYFLAALGLCCCTWAFSSCSEHRLLSVCGAWASHCGGFSVQKMGSGVSGLQ